MNLSRIFLNNSHLPRHGLDANPSGKLETKVPADLAGLSELLKPCLTVSALPVDRLFKLESQLRISFRAAEFPAVMDAMVATHQEHSTTGKTPELLPDGSTKPKTGVTLTPSPPAITTPPVNTALAEPHNPLPNATNNASLNILSPTLKTNFMLSPFTAFPPKLPKSKPKS